MTTCLLECVRPTAAQAHCSECHITFGGVVGFDKHRVDGECLDPEDLGMMNLYGIWRRTDYTGKNSA